MSENEKKHGQRQAASTDAGQQEVQQVFDKANEQGFFGFTTDPTPDDHYTLQGQSKGLSTPETDDDARDAARKEAGIR